MLKRILSWLLPTIIVEFMIGPIGGRTFDWFMKRNKGWALPDIPFYQQGYLTVFVAGILMGSLIVRWRPRWLGFSRPLTFTARKRGVRWEATNMLVTHHFGDDVRVTQIALLGVNENGFTLENPSGHLKSLKTGRSFSLYIEVGYGYVPLESVFAIPAKRTFHLAAFPFEPAIDERRLTNGTVVRIALPVLESAPRLEEFEARHSGFELAISFNKKSSRIVIPNEHLENFRTVAKAKLEERLNVTPIEVRPEWNSSGQGSGSSRPLVAPA